MTKCSNNSITTGSLIVCTLSIFKPFISNSKMLFSMEFLWLNEFLTTKLSLLLWEIVDYWHIFHWKKHIMYAFVNIHTSKRSSISTSKFLVKRTYCQFWLRNGNLLKLLDTDLKKWFTCDLVTVNRYPRRYHTTNAL